MCRTTPEMVYLPAAGVNGADHGGVHQCTDTPQQPRERLDLLFDAPSPSPPPRSHSCPPHPTLPLAGPPGPKPWALAPSLQGPLLVLWGTKDVFTPADGPVGRYMQHLPSVRPETTFKFVEGGSWVGGAHDGSADGRTGCMHVSLPG